MAEADSPTLELPESIGRYRVVRLLGEGAMGRVLLAHDPVLDREVAIKHLRADLSIPDDVRRGLVTRMRHEARAAARVMHPNLVTLHDMGEDDRVGLYLVFEYVEGPTLKERVAKGRLAPADAARVAVELGTALTMAHDAGILHRDVKPENVICSRKGAKIADFGIAKIPDSTLTHQGGLMGTPAYSAPETFRTSTFSPESDQFSLAATLYEAVSGKRAFPGDDAVAVAQRILHESAEPFAESVGVPGEVDVVFARALSRKPRERFPSCEAFGRALAAALAASGPAAGGGADAGGRLAAGSGGGSSPATATGGLAADGASLGAGELPRERKGTHVVLGVIAVLVTGTLLVRTALQPEEPADPAAATSASAPPPPAASPTFTPRPRLPARRPTSLGPAATAGATAAPTASADADADAGAADAGDATGTSTESAPSTETETSTDTDMDAGAPADAAPTTTATPTSAPSASGVPADAGATTPASAAPRGSGSASVPIAPRDAGR